MHLPADTRETAKKIPENLHTSVSVHPEEAVPIPPAVQKTTRVESLEHEIAAVPSELLVATEDDVPATEPKEPSFDTQVSMSRASEPVELQNTTAQMPVIELVEKPVPTKPLPVTSDQHVVIETVVLADETIESEELPADEPLSVDDVTIETIMPSEETEPVDSSVAEMGQADYLTELPEPDNETEAIPVDGVPAENSDLSQNQISPEHHALAAEKMLPSLEIGLLIVEKLEILEQNQVIELETVLAEMLHVFETLEDTNTMAEDVKTELIGRLEVACAHLAELTGIDAKYFVPAELAPIIVSMKLPVPTLQYLQRLQSLGTHEYLLHKTHLLHGLRLSVRDMLFHNWLGRTAIKY